MLSFGFAGSAGNLPQKGIAGFDEFGVRLFQQAARALVRLGEWQGFVIETS